VTQPTNRHPVDELADVRAERRRLEEREAELRNVLLAHGADLDGMTTRRGFFTGIIPGSTTDWSFVALAKRQPLNAARPPRQPPSCSAKNAVPGPKNTTKKLLRPKPRKCCQRNNKRNGYGDDMFSVTPELKGQQAQHLLPRKACYANAQREWGLNTTLWVGRNVLRPLGGRLLRFGAQP
jgi:hypothetical protein